MNVNFSDLRRIYRHMSWFLVKEMEKMAIENKTIDHSLFIQMKKDFWIKSCCKFKGFKEELW